MTPPELEGVTDKDRFELELEFVSALANPRYVHHLAKEGFLRDSRFVAFLRYLSYWERPEYAKFILYPHALRFRRELEREEFRRAMENPRNAERVFAAQYTFWASRSASASAGATTAPTS
jgi:mediator of RNA polymerase II transcription subunit 31